MAFCVRSMRHVSQKGVKVSGSVVNGALKFLKPEGLSHTVNGGTNGTGHGSIAICRRLLGAKPSVLSGGGETREAFCSFFFVRGCFPALHTIDNTNDGSIVVLGVSKNTEESANAESSTTEVEVIMDGQVSTNNESANAAAPSAELPCNVVEGIVDGDVTTEESAAKDPTQSPGMLKLLKEKISPASRAMKRGGMILRFDEGEEMKDNEKNKVAGGVAKVQGCQQQQAKNKINTDMKDHVEDVVFSKLVKERNIESFKSLADVTPVMEQYQKQSGCQVAICRSEVDKFRVYKCAEHVN
ncbi:hypothetical protein MHU86_7058 [Fragilaria crotonensis]|nr:hypothetical protein MHU86_7058 [Fragilaria crotonensis]